MPYRKSNARSEFETTTTELLALARSVSYKKVKLSYEHKNLIYQSSIVLLCSAIEEYLRVFIEDLFYSYRVNGAILAEIPTNSRTFALFKWQQGKYESFVHSRDEAKLLCGLMISDPIYSIIADNQSFTNNVNAKSIISNKKYPSPKNLKTLFNRIGIADIFKVIEARGKKNFKEQLRSFLDIRETIAHNESTDLTFKDIYRHFANITKIVNMIDRSTHTQICKVSGSKYWR